MTNFMDGLISPTGQAVLVTVGTVAAALAAFFSIWQFILQRSRWRTEDFGRGPFARLLIDPFPDGWWHVVVDCRNRFHGPVELIAVKALKPRKLLLSREDGNHPNFSERASRDKLQLNVKIPAYFPDGKNSGSPGGATIYVKPIDGEFLIGDKIRLRLYLRESDRLEEQGRMKWHRDCSVTINKLFHATV